MTRVGFSTSNKLLSRFIRWVTGADVSHVWFLFERDGKDYVFQADMGGIQINDYMLATSKWTIIKIIPLKVDIELPWDKLGEHYDYGGLIGNFFVYVGRWLKKKWSNPFASAHAMFCSELVAFTLEEKKYPGADQLGDISRVSPKDIEAFLEQ